MATGKQGFVRAAEPQHSVAVQGEKEMHVQAPLPAMYIQAVSRLPSYPQAQPAGVQDAAVLPLSVPMMYTNQALPFLTLHIASGAGLQQQRPELPVSSSRPKSLGKHVCPHCGRDCLKPSVLEKHLRCHTGERPYPCATCGISFKTQSNLYKHKRTQAHARLSSESGKETFSSQDSTESSRENCSSPLLELQKEDSGDTNRNDDVLQAVAMSTGGSGGVKTGSETEWALCKAAVVGVIASPAHGQQVLSHTITQRVPQLSSDAAPIMAKSPNEDGRAPLTPNRTPLQRQEALFPKPQSHDSTDSGFSECNEQTSTCSPGATMHNPSMELEEPEMSEKLPDMCTDDIKDKVSLQEKQKLEKHILKLISENSVVMDDKHLVNVRPRKTVLSKQGSIDLPMPYTYKDSFHFEIRSSKQHLVGSQRQDRNGRAIYSSMPTQHSTSLEHAPLTRSSSLPFSVGIQKSDSTVSPYNVDNTSLSRRCSAGHIYTYKSVDQHTPSHRSLVRQVAVDGLFAVEGSPMERGSLSSLSSDGDCADSASETAVKRSRRKKAQKFAYNKWYMYGGGTFKKLYNLEKDPVLKSRKSTISPEQTDSQVTQRNNSNLSGSGSLSYTSCSAAGVSPVANVLTAQTSSQVPSSYVLVQNTPVKQMTGQQSTQPSLIKQTNVPSSDLSTAIKTTEEKVRAPETQLSTPIPSERKKQKTDEHLSSLVENTEALIRMQQCTSRQVNTNLGQSLPSECVEVPQKSSLTLLQRDNELSLNRQGSFTSLSSSSNQRQLLFKRHSSPLFMANMSGTSASPSASSSISSISQAKSSFLPKYQLKIPVLTDGISESTLGKSSLLNPSSPRQNISLNQQCAKISPSTTQNQSAMFPGQEQSSLCITAITNGTPVTSVVYSCHDANADTSTYTSTTSCSLASPLALTDLNVTVSTISVSTVNNVSTSTKHVSSVQENPVTPVVIPTQSPRVIPTPAIPSSPEGIPLEISSTEIAGSQDTFYVQTADLQIVMQLISDEQLALIEPQIELQDYKTTGSHCFFSKDPEMANTDPNQTSVSQERHKQHSDHTRTKQSVQQGNLKCSVLNSVPDIPDNPDVTLMSFGSTVTEHQAKSTNSTQDICATNTVVKAVISRSPSKSEHNVSTLLDCKTLGQQCKSLNSTPENKTMPKNSETAGCGISARSYRSHKQKPSEKLSKDSGDKSTPKNESQVSKFSAQDQIMGNYSTSIICSVQKKCQDTTKSHGTSDTAVASNKIAIMSPDGKIKVASFPEITARSPNHQPGQMTVQQHKSFEEIHAAETNTSRISVASSGQALALTPISALNQKELINQKSHQSSGTSSAMERPSSSRSVLACRVCPQHPLNQTGGCSGDRSKYEENETSTAGQSEQHLALHDLGKNQEVKETISRTARITSAQSEPQRPLSTCLNEENLKCALDPSRMLQVNQDTITGPPVSCSPQSLTLQWEAGAEKQQWIPLEPKNRGGDGPEWLGTWKTQGVWTKQEEYALENKGEEANYTDSYIQKAVKTHPNLSTSQHVSNITRPPPELVSISTTLSVCEKSSPSHERKCLTNKAHVVENSPNAAPKLTDQSHTKVKKQDSLGHCERFTSLSRGPGDIRHLLAHPSLLNDIQKEVQKETQTKNSARQLTHSTILQAQRPSTERETDGPIMLNELYMTSPCHTEHCQIIKTTPVYTRPSCSNQTNSSYKHPNPTSTSSIHSNAAEHNTLPSYMEEEEEEERSSSDDEGKLVIELE